MAHNKAAAAETVEKTSWFAVFSLFLGVTGLVAAEFLPISLLTPMATDLGISAGTAGQSVTAVGLFAVTASLLAAPLAQHRSRRFILPLFSALLIISNLLAALAPNFALLLVGRAALGICVGGFWSLAAATVLRLAAPRQVAKALSFVFAGVSVATILAVPVAGYAGQFIGWRGVFAVSCLFGLITFLCQYWALPFMPARAAAAEKQGKGVSAGIWAAYQPLLQTGWINAGLLAVMGCYGGYYVLFTYLRPFFEQGLHLSGNSLSIVLLGFSLANCAGTFSAGAALERFFRQTMIAGHSVLALVPLALFFSGGKPAADSALLMLWGAAFGIICVGWSAWIIRTMPERSEAGGGLMVAAIQFSVMSGAGLGGFIFDHGGFQAVLPAAFVILAASVILLGGSFRFYRAHKGRQV